jgi:hypothetical protein
LQCNQKQQKFKAAPAGKRGENKMETKHIGFERLEEARKAGVVYDDYKVLEVLENAGTPGEIVVEKIEDAESYYLRTKGSGLPFAEYPKKSFPIAGAVYNLIYSSSDDYDLNSEDFLNNSIS